MSKYLLALVAGLIATPAMSADISPATYKTPVTAVYSAPTWAGLYGGLNAGYASADVSVAQTNGGMPYGPFGYSPSGFIGGGQLGYNLQSGSLVYGLEGDLGYLGTTGSGIIPSSVPGLHQNLTLDGGFYGDITGRLGWASGNVLFYGKGGYAYFDGKSTQTTMNPGYVSNPASGFSGWTAGGGIEWLFAQNVSLKVEYQHFDFGNKTGGQTSLTDPPIGFFYSNRTNLTFDTVKAGINYHWN